MSRIRAVWCEGMTVWAVFAIVLPSLALAQAPAPPARARMARDGRGPDAAPFIRAAADEIRPIVRAEAHFMRTVCELSDTQRGQLATHAERIVEDLAEHLGRTRAERAPVNPAPLDPGPIVRRDLSDAIKTLLTDQQSERLIDARRVRNEARRKAITRCLVARIDQDLLLTAEQRAKLEEELVHYSHEDWWPDLASLAFAAQGVPNMHPSHLAPILTGAQMTAWSRLPKSAPPVAVRFRGNVIECLPADNPPTKERAAARRGAGKPSAAVATRTLLLGACAPVVLARPQDPDDDNAEAEPAPQPRVAVRKAIPDTYIDERVFGSPQPEQTRKQLDALADVHVDDVDRGCRLTADQAGRLSLAAHGDVKRFFDRVAETKRKFNAVQTDRNALLDLVRKDVPALHAAFEAGLFGDDSLVVKASKTILSAEQAARYDDWLRERSEYRYRSRIDLTVALWTEALGLRAEQARKVTEVLVARTRAPRRYASNDYYLVAYQAAQIPEAELKPIFDEPQWFVLERHLRSQRDRGANFLSGMGYVFEAEKKR